MKYAFKKGDRVDFADWQHPGFGQGTFGTIHHRVHGVAAPRYVVRWDDDDESNKDYDERDLVSAPQGANTDG